MATATEEHKFHSKPYSRRPGFIIAATVLVLGWIVAIGLLVTAAFHYSNDSMFGYFELLSALGLCAFTALVTFILVHEKNIAQELVIEDDALSLSTIDNNENTMVTQSLAFKDVVRAEHYKMADTDAIVLHGKQEDLEIPTWCFDHEIDLLLVEKLRAENIPIEGVPLKLEEELEHHHHLPDTHPHNSNHNHPVTH